MDKGVWRFQVQSEQIPNSYPNLWKWNILKVENGNYRVNVFEYVGLNKSASSNIGREMKNLMHFLVHLPNYGNFCVYKPKFGFDNVAGKSNKQLTGDEIFKRLKSYPSTKLGSEYVVPGKLISTLPEYQKAGVAWMLDIEHGKVSSFDEFDVHHRFVFTDGQEDLSFDSIAGVFTFRQIVDKPPLGGILADEMGLGKTVQVIACILSNPFLSHDATPPKDNASAAKDTRLLGDARLHKDDTLIEVLHSNIENNNIANVERTSITKIGREPILNNFKKWSRLLETDMNRNNNAASNKDTETTLYESVDCVCGESVLDNSTTCSNCRYIAYHAKCARVVSNGNNFVCLNCQMKRNLMDCKTTLVVSPQAIHGQWADEIANHTSKNTVSVLIYDGVKAARSNKKFNLLSPANLAKYDVVITTYAALRGDLCFAEQGSRRLRKKRKYARVHSPLTKLNFWRICLDEAQMVERTSSKCAVMVNKLSGVHRWCVTGTPISLRNPLDELYGLCIFLRFHPLDIAHYWKRIIRQSLNHERLFSIFDKFLWRNTLQSVGDQLKLPMKNELVHWLDFSTVEQNFYQKQVFECLKDTNKRTTMEDQLFNGLLRLRQACCHPQVGSYGITAVTRRPLTMGAILHTLVNDARRNVEEEQRKLIAARNGLAGILMIFQNTKEAARNYFTTMDLIRQNWRKYRADALQRLHVLVNVQIALQESYPKLNFPSNTCHEDTLEVMALIHPDYILPNTDFVDLSSFSNRQSDTTSDADATDYEVFEKSILEQQIDDGKTSLSNDEPKLDQPKIVKPKIDRILPNDESKGNESHNTKIAAPFKNTAKPEEYIAKGKVNSKTTPSYVPDIPNLKLACSRYTLHTLNEAESQEYLALSDSVHKLKQEYLANNSTNLIVTSQKFVACRTEVEKVLKSANCITPLQLGLNYISHFSEDQANELLHTLNLKLLDHNYEFLSIEGLRFFLNQRETALFEARAAFLMKLLKNSRKPTKDEISISGNCGNCREGAYGPMCYYCKAMPIVEEYTKTLFGDAGLQESNVEFSRFNITCNEVMKACKACDAGKKLSNWMDSLKKEQQLGLKIWILQQERLGLLDELAMCVGRLSCEEFQEDLYDSYRVPRLMLAEQEVQLKMEKDMVESTLRTADGRFKYLSQMEDLAEYDCAICRETNAPDQLMLSCGHSFCSECIREMMAIKRVKIQKALSCPSCRRRILLKDIVPVIQPGDSERYTSKSLGFGKKVDSIVWKVENILTKDRSAKCLIFTQWQDMLLLISKCFQKKGIPFESLIHRKNYQSVLSSFRHKKNSNKVLGLTFQQGSNGLNLTEANHVFLVEPLLDTRVEDQAICRVHRMGQTRSTTVHRFLIRNTVEQRIWNFRNQIKTNENSVSRTSKNKENVSLNVEDLQQLIKAESIAHPNTLVEASSLDNPISLANS